MRLVCHAIFRLLLAQIAYCAPKVYQFYVLLDDFTLQSIYIGTNRTQLRVGLSLASPDNIIVDGVCGADYGKCRKYCDVPTLCSIYCNPICCMSSTLRQLRCEGPLKGYYLHESLEFVPTKEHWRSSIDDAVGIYAQDILAIAELTGDELKIRPARIALNVVSSMTDLAQKYQLPEINKLGLRRRYAAPSFVEEIYRAGLIPQPILTFTHAQTQGYRSIYLGTRHDLHCDEWSRVPFAHDVEFMFDSVEVDFLGHQKSGNFRTMLSEGRILYLQPQVISFLLAQKAVVLKENTDYVYYLNPIFANSTLSWTFSTGFKVALTTELTTYKTPSFIEIYLKALEPNPDNVQWILNHAVFYKLRSVYVGTNRTLLYADLSFASPDNIIIDGVCEPNYGKCQKYCDVPTLCSIYCNPICCMSTVLRRLRCDGRFMDQYQHESSEFVPTKEYWRSAVDDAVGIYADDVVAIRDGTSFEMTVRPARIALNVVSSMTDIAPDVNKRENNKLGLRRRYGQSSFIQELAQNKIIPKPVISFTHVKIAGSRAVYFGARHDLYCGEWSTVPFVHEVEFMFDTIDVEFFGYKKTGNFRTMLTEGRTFSLHPEAISHLLAQKIIDLKNETDDTYYVDAAFKNTTLHWTFSTGFRLEFSAEDAIYGTPTFSQIYLKVLWPNPDNVQWILSHALFYQYCVAIDYEADVVQFAVCTACYANKLETPWRNKPSITITVVIEGSAKKSKPLRNLSPASDLKDAEQCTLSVARIGEYLGRACKARAETFGIDLKFLMACARNGCRI
ncbi:unnamed protein product [Bursaphelenchus xylophilus]|uniref:(pine wood nematode) hypothetical protein n=1 Tax=Bursaphelenchus xylophilus TaxID=6326 RepID=A0A1I7S892_BURXY|nr:unnamed protein product [Bursaphelenchus xylophilus]CAG9080409.1 unnamed protein product [Bursaphelenchus xylophilus]